MKYTRNVIYTLVCLGSVAHIQESLGKTITGNTDSSNTLQRFIEVQRNIAYTDSSDTAVDEGISVAYAWLEIRNGQHAELNIQIQPATTTVLSGAGRLELTTKLNISYNMALGLNPGSIKVSSPAAANWILTQLRPTPDNSQEFTISAVYKGNFREEGFNKPLNLRLDLDIRDDRFEWHPNDFGIYRNASIPTPLKTLNVFWNKAMIWGCENNNCTATAGRPDLYLTSAGSAGNIPEIFCEYVITEEWPGGFNARLDVKNETGTAITAWSVQWIYKDGSEIAHGWNANVAPGTINTAKPTDWNKRIPSGGEVSIGVQGRTPDIFSRASYPDFLSGVCTPE